MFLYNKFANKKTKDWILRVTCDYIIKKIAVIVTKFEKESGINIWWQSVKKMTTYASDVPVSQPCRWFEVEKKIQIEEAKKQKRCQWEEWQQQNKHKAASEAALAIGMQCSAVDQFIYTKSTIVKILFTDIIIIGIKCIFKLHKEI